MAINAIKSFPVLPIHPVRQKNTSDDKERQKQHQEDDEENRQAKQNPSGSEDGHIDEYA